MQDHPSPPGLGDAAIQRVVMALVLAAHPKSLTIPGLGVEINLGDAVERAVRDLVGVGLLECRGVSIKPSPAALRLEHLELP